MTTRSTSRSRASRSWGWSPRQQAHFSGQVDAYVGELVVASTWEGLGGRPPRICSGREAGPLAGA